MRKIRIVRVVHVILAVVLLGAIYWLPPVDMREDLKLEDAHIADAKKRMSEWWNNGHGKDLELVDLPFVKLAFAEHDKIIAEIANNAKSMNEWFQLKFIFIGTIFAGVFFNLYFKDKKNGQEPEEIIKRSITRQIGFGVIAISLFVCIAADLHIKERQKGSGEGGLWIRHFIEPIFLSPNDPKDVQKTKLLEERWVGWEQFLRDAKNKKGEGTEKVEGKKGECKESVDQGIISRLHFTARVTLFNWVPLHSLTFLIFILYVYTMQEWQLNRLRVGRRTLISIFR